jgi:serine/threonine-protein kinase
MYYLGVLFDKLWNENPEKIFSYKEVIKKMIKYDPNKRYNSFKEINEKLINDSFKMEFDKTEKECYIKFADFLTNTLSSFGETPIFRDKYQDIIFKLKEFYRSNQLENKIINFGNLVACFVENNSFTYNSNYTEDISVLANFLSLLLNSDEDKRKVLINHILNRISSITVSYDFPF